MTRKMNFIPHIDNYEWIRNQMKEDLMLYIDKKQERRNVMSYLLTNSTLSYAIMNM